MKPHCYTLRSIGLRKSSCELLSSGKAESKGDVFIKYKVESFLPQNASDGERFDLMISVELDMSGQESESKETVFQLNTVHYGGFTVDDGTKPDSECQQLAHELSKQVFPIAREHANELLFKMGFRSAYLPWSLDQENQESEDNKEAKE